MMIVFVKFCRSPNHSCGAVKLAPRILKYASAHTIGIVATFWTIERIAGF
jgi:hypothetical protein